MSSDLLLMAAIQARQVQEQYLQPMSHEEFMRREHEHGLRFERKQARAERRKQRVMAVRSWFGAALTSDSASLTPDSVERRVPALRA